MALPMPWNLEMPSAENSLNSGFSLVMARIKSSLDKTKVLFCSILFIVTRPWILRYMNLIQMYSRKSKIALNSRSKAQHMRANMLNYNIRKCVNCILSLQKIMPPMKYMYFIFFQQMEKIFLSI